MIPVQSDDIGSEPEDLKEEEPQSENLIEEPPELSDGAPEKSDGAENVEISDEEETVPAMKTNNTDQLKEASDLFAEEILPNKWWESIESSEKKLHGEWILARNGDGFDELLKRMGVDNWIKRRTLHKKSTRCKIIHKDGTSAWFILSNEKAMDLRANGKYFDITRANGQQSRMQASFDHGRQTLIVITENPAGTMRIERFVNEDDELVVNMDFEGVVCSRYFRREDVSTQNSVTSFFGGFMTRI